MDNIKLVDRKIKFLENKLIFLEINTGNEYCQKYYEYILRLEPRIDNFCGLDANMYDRIIFPSRKKNDDIEKIRDEITFLKNMMNTLYTGL